MAAASLVTPRWPLLSWVCKEASLAALPATRDEDPETQQMVQAALESRLRAEGVFRIQIEGYASRNTGCVLPALGYTTSRRAEFYLDLFPDVDRTWARLRQQRRTKIRKAINSQLTVRSDRGEEGIRTLLRLHEESLHRKGVMDSDHEEQFVRLLQFFQDPERADLLICDHEGVAAGTLVYGVFDDQACTILAGTSVDGNRHGAMALLVWRMIEGLSQRQVKHLCLGGVALESGEDPSTNGLYQFKKDFGCDVVDQPGGSKTLAPSPGATLDGVRSRCKVALQVVRHATRRRFPLSPKPEGCSVSLQGKSPAITGAKPGWKQKRMSSGLVAKVGKSIEHRGLFGTVRHAMRMASAAVIEECHDRREQAIRQRIDHRFDRSFGIETGGRLAPAALEVSGVNLPHSSHYEAVYPEPFVDLIGQLPIDFEQSLFIDLGSGKGRAVLLASEFPFRRIIGVEFSPKLHLIAEVNCSKYVSATQKCKTIELHCIDAVDYVIPPFPAVVFMYNPFRREVLTRIAAKIERSLREIPRTVFVVYFNPQVCDVWDSIDCLEILPVRQPIWPGSRGQVVLVWFTRGSWTSCQSELCLEETL